MSSSPSCSRSCGRRPLAVVAVVIQEHGTGAAEFVEALTGVGAVGHRGSDLPVEVALMTALPVWRLIEGVADGRIDAVTFTSAPAVHNLFAIARHDEGADGDDVLRRGFNRGVVAVCVGGVCADGARPEGIDSAPRSCHRSARPARARVE